jgi:hypothetical protein
VVKTIYKEGKFLNAMGHAKASEQNESNTVVLAEPKGDGRPIVVVKQIVGLIARRSSSRPRRATCWPAGSASA